MSFLEILLVGVALSLDCCAIALASTLAGRINDRRSALRLSFHFGLFQFLMPVAGWAVGAQIQQHVAAFDHWVAFGLLAVVGLRMIRSAKDDASTDAASDPSRGWMLVTLAFATSIDALAVGLGLAALGISAWYPCAVIGLITMLLSMCAIGGGACVGKWLGAKAQIIGGFVLLLIGVKILISDLA